MEKASPQPTRANTSVIQSKMNDRMAMAGLVSPSAVCFFYSTTTCFVFLLLSLAVGSDVRSGWRPDIDRVDGKTMPLRVDRISTGKMMTSQQEEEKHFSASRLLN